MKELFLSFKSDYFKPLFYGIKKYEYRKRFCAEETRAYLYLSGKSRHVIGFMDLGKPIRLDSTLDEYKNHPKTLKRVLEYISNRDVNAVPIKSLTLFKEPLSLDKIREEIPGFMPPQMYFVLDNHCELKKLLMSQELGEKVFEHRHDEIYYDNLAVSISELEKTREFEELDSIYKEKVEKYQ